MAFAAVHGAIVVTNEQPVPKARRVIKIPNVCNKFGVAYCNTFQMLKDLKVCFGLSEGTQENDAIEGIF